MTKISDDGRFEWDTDKNKQNIKRHGLSFEQILSVFDDPFFLERYDKEHSSETEERYFGLGCITGIVVIAASYTETKRIRIISARLASPKEEEIYNEYCKHINR
ncbi:BrnT family toxin [Treponema sp. OMZ 840]|uniref:BrnT family toxin n=1 Tax=Treponema sp. OMZ 840 TaxID=244313 RepID=UPI003D8C5C01